MINYITHKFSVELAKIYGIKEAIILDKFAEYCSKYQSKTLHASFMDIAPYFPYIGSTCLYGKLRDMYNAGILCKDNPRAHRGTKVNYWLSDRVKRDMEKCGYVF